MLFTSKRVIKKLPIKLDFINKITKSKYFFYGILILSVLRLIKFYRENNTLCLGIFILFILLFVNKKNLNIKINFGKKREIALGLLFCISITTLLCHEKRLIEGNTGSIQPLSQPLSQPLVQQLLSIGKTQFQSNNIYGEEELTKCEENFKKENKSMEELEIGIDSCNFDIEKLQVKEGIVIGEMKGVIKDKIKILNELKLQLENQKKLLEGHMDKERFLEKKAYLITPQGLITGGNRPIPVEEYENPLFKKITQKNFKTPININKISKMKTNQKIPESVFKEKDKINSIEETSIGPSKYN